MYAIIADGSHQYRVEEGETLWVLSKEGEPGKKLTFPALLVADGKDVSVGTPHVEGAEVEGEVVEHARGDKIKVFKYIRRENYHRTRGSRQEFTAVKITKINPGKK